MFGSCSARGRTVSHELAWHHRKTTQPASEAQQRCDTKMRPEYLQTGPQIIFRNISFVSEIISLANVPYANTHRDRFMACAAATHRGGRGQLLLRELSIFFLHGQRHNRTLDKTAERPTTGHWVGRGMKKRGFSMKSFHSITTLVFLRQCWLDPGSCSGGVT